MQKIWYFACNLGSEETGTMAITTLTGRWITMAAVEWNLYLSGIENTKRWGQVNKGFVYHQWATLKVFTIALGQLCHQLNSQPCPMALYIWSVLPNYLVSISKKGESVFMSYFRACKLMIDFSIQTLCIISDKEPNLYNLMITSLSHDRGFLSRFPLGQTLGKGAKFCDNS